MKCPKCKTKLREQESVKYNPSGKHKSLGMKLYCPNKSCDYEDV